MLVLELLADGEVGEIQQLANGLDASRGQDMRATPCGVDDPELATLALELGGVIKEAREERERGRVDAQLGELLAQRGAGVGDAVERASPALRVVVAVLEAVVGTRARSSGSVCQPTRQTRAPLLTRAGWRSHGRRRARARSRGRRCRRAAR